MATLSLLFKDLREHGLAALALLFGSFVTVLVALLQNENSAYSLSPFEVVRFILLTLFPLLAVILGNRLLVREYLSGTRLFVEALPVGLMLPLVLKYLVGLSYLLFLTVVIVGSSALVAGVADDVTPFYAGLMFGKSAALVLLYWSISFCFSLCGFLRVAMYMTLSATVLMLINTSGIDASRVPPIDLLDRDLFVYERDIVPWRAIIGTVVIAAFFTAAGFLIARLGEGSVAARLAKPMSRRDYVVLGVLVMGGIGVWSALQQRLERESFEFTSSTVIRLEEARISVSYLSSEYEDSGRAVALRLENTLLGMQAALGLPVLAPVRVSLFPDKDKHDIEYATIDGAFFGGNWLDHDSYDDMIMDSVILHGLLSSITGGRAVFEPYHWVLDGFTRWWVEQGLRPIDPLHREELLARAMYALSREAQVVNLITHWQLTAERFAYPTAEALAWSAMAFLEETKGADVVIALAREFLTKRIPVSSLASFKDRRVSTAERFESVTGLMWTEFVEQWQQWLIVEANTPGVIQRLSYIPPFRGRVVSTNDAGAHSLDGRYELIPTVDAGVWDGVEFFGECAMKHSLLAPFDDEFDVVKDDADIQDCALDTEHRLYSYYAPGDRVFIALDFISADFHQPIRLHAERVTIP